MTGLARARVLLVILWVLILQSSLLEGLRAAGIQTFVVGDAAEARGFEGITRDAEDTARALAGAG